MTKPSDLNMWEILIPTVRNDGRPFRLRFHKVWDEHVKEIAGGLTVVAPVKGTWVNPHGIEFKERMIPVRIMCTEAEIMSIAEHTKVFYDQEAILVFKISEKCFVV